MKLGDAVSAALSKVGITEERVSSWIGEGCGCGERRKKLNALSDWVMKKVGVMTDEEAKKDLEKTIEGK